VNITATLSVHFGAPEQIFSHGCSWQRTKVNGFCDLEELILNFSWSPIVWTGDRRAKANFFLCHFCVLDFDEGPTIEESIERFRGLSFLLGTTKSHQIRKGSKPACDRYRVVIPFARPISDLDIFEATMRRCVRQYQSDPATCDGARCWKPCRDIVAKQKGAAIEPVDVVPPGEDAATQISRRDQRTKKYKSLGSLPPRVVDFLQGKIEPHTRNTELFVVSCQLFELGWSYTDVSSLLEGLPFLQDHTHLKSTIRSAARKCKTADRLELGGGAGVRTNGN